MWLNEAGGLTFEIVAYGGRGERVFAKWSPPAAADLRDEAERLRWAGSWTPVPRVLDAGADESGSWLVTTALPGSSAVEDRWKARPAIAVRALGEGLRALHDALPVDSCPFTWSVADRVEAVRRRWVAGLVDPSAWRQGIRAAGGPGAGGTGLEVAAALALLDDAPPIDRLVVCHGDPCAPNTLLTAAGRWSGHVDLGSLGVADRWADLAVAGWSATWNYGPAWERPLLDAYGIEPDDARTAWYRVLWDLG